MYLLLLILGLVRGGDFGEQAMKEWRKAQALVLAREPVHHLPKLVPLFKDSPLKQIKPTLEKVIKPLVEIEDSILI
jgi:hypothetical protein